MNLIVTLKSGVQISMDVDDFSTGSSPIFGELRSLTWTRSARSTSAIHWLNLEDVVAIHATGMEPPGEGGGA